MNSHLQYTRVITADNKQHFPRKKNGRKLYFCEDKITKQMLHKPFNLHETKAARKHVPIS